MGVLDLHVGNFQTFEQAVQVTALGVDGLEESLSFDKFVQRFKHARELLKDAVPPTGLTALPAPAAPPVATPSSRGTIEVLRLRMTARVDAQMRASLLKHLAQLSKNECRSDVMAVHAREEEDRLVEISERGVSLTFLRHLSSELETLNRSSITCYELLWGASPRNTPDASPAREFSRAQDPYSIKACTLHTGTSLVETWSVFRDFARRSKHN